MTAKANEFLDFVLDQLSDLGDVRAKPMFGGHGLYRGPTFFGVVYGGRLYLKVDDNTRPWYESKGMSYFNPNEKQHIKTYYEVPADALESRSDLTELADEAASVRD